MRIFNKAEKFFEISHRAKNDFNYLASKLEKKTPFTFIRFSDGEMEIIRNEKLVIKENEVIWSKGIVKHSYPVFDYKCFDPFLHSDLREDLIKSAKFKSDNYIKGIPTRHNGAVVDRDLMVNLNGNSDINLTFADLFLNQNFLRFRKMIMPNLLRFSSVYYVGNFRAEPGGFSQEWRHIKVPDDVFQNYKFNKKTIFENLANTPSNSLLLLSASSFSNILAYELNLVRNDLTILDIGTSIHDLVGLQSGIREYHILLRNKGFKSMIRRYRYRLSKGYKLKW